MILVVVHEFTRVPYAVIGSDHIINPQALNPHVKISLKVMCTDVLEDEREASSHFPFQKPYQLQHLKIHLSAR